jgi:hypothetical protein
MNRTKRLAYILGAVAILLWVLPYARAVKLYWESSTYLTETGSSDAGRDVDFSLDLLHSYTYSVAAALLVAWCVGSGRRTPLFVLPAFIILFAVFEVLRIHPENPIVFFPSMRPYRPAIISLAGLGVALAVRWFPPTLTARANKAW